MYEFLRSLTFGRGNRKKTRPTRRAALANTESISPENNSGPAQVSQALCNRFDVQSRRIWHLGLGRPQNEESYQPRRDARSHDTSWSISKCETHFSDYLLVVAGESVLHYMVTSQNSPTVKEYFDKEGVRFARDFTLKINQKPYFNFGIFTGDLRQSPYKIWILFVVWLSFLKKSLPY
jgi:hypothetical protein